MSMMMRRKALPILLALPLLAVVVYWQPAPAAAQGDGPLPAPTVELTGTEYAVLYQLAAQAPNVLTHGLLLRRVWAPERAGEGWLLRNVVKKLRRNLGGDAANPRYIVTEPRVGYRMAAETAERVDGSAGLSSVELPAQLE